MSRAYNNVKISLVIHTGCLAPPSTLYTDRLGLKWPHNKEVRAPKSSAQPNFVDHLLHIHKLHNTTYRSDNGGGSLPLIICPSSSYLLSKVFKTV